MGFFGIIGGNGFDAPLLSASASVSAFGCFILPILLLLLTISILLIYFLNVIERLLQIGERARRLVVRKGEESMVGNHNIKLSKSAPKLMDFTKSRNIPPVPM